MQTLHVIAGPGAGEPIGDLDLLRADYDVHVVRTAEPSDLPAGVDGHLVVTASVPESVVAVIAGWAGERVHGLVVLTDSVESHGLTQHLPTLASWQAPTLVVAPAQGALRETGQLLSAGVPDAVFVVTEDAPAAPGTTTVEWLASFLSIVDGLRPEAPQ